MIIKGATGVAIAAAIGNLLQGWDGGAIAGGCPNITRTLFLFLFLLPSSLDILLLPCFSHCDGPPIHLFEHYSSSQTTRFATRKKKHSARITHWFQTSLPNLQQTTGANL
jgi:hypothetical protein